MIEKILTKRLVTLSDEISDHFLFGVAVVALSFSSNEFFAYHLSLLLRLISSPGAPPWHVHPSLRGEIAS